MAYKYKQVRPFNNIETFHTFYYYYLGRPSPSKKMKLDHTTKIIKVEKVEEDPETTRKPNSRGQMNWNRQAITDLLDCHKSSQLEQRNLSLESTKKIPKLSELVHSKFIGKYIPTYN